MFFEKLKVRWQIFLLELFDLLAFLVFVTGIVLFVRFFIFNPYTVVGQSMEPVFHQGDFIIVDKVSPRFWSFKRGDIIIFVPQGKDVPYIKRIIGMPWETVRVVDNWVYICQGNVSLEDCQKLDEDAYTMDNAITSGERCQKDTFVIDDQWYFVMWDHRWFTTDSLCCFGLSCYEWANYLVYPKDIIGKVAIRLFPEVSFYW
jgi:signal peptidase I